MLIFLPRLPERQSDTNIFVLECRGTIVYKINTYLISEIYVHIV